jgi:hypothetical protein
LSCLVGEQRRLEGRIRDLRLEMKRELGGITAAVNRTLGPVLLWSVRRDARRYQGGRPLEPRTFVERTA